MDPIARHARISELFLEACELEGDARHALMERACSGDTDLRAAVDRLLAQHDGDQGFLSDRALEDFAAGRSAARAAEPLAEAPGSRIGPYKLLQRIGEGGFGVVYLAEQEDPILRRVALKIIKLGMDTAQVVARFEAERQALALMDHPNIARVLDAGATQRGRPYFVMELVRGEAITTYCDRANLSVEERLALFIDVCGAVQHAHQKGVIHRDLKPSNVMVTLHDGRPVPKVIDFGVAKAMDRRLTERTLFTEYGQLIGTPTYMSPEQAGMSGLDIDTRSDVYSLGVLLYELLTGTTPIDVASLRDAGYGGLQRIIRDEEPPRPSTRLSALSSASSPRRRCSRPAPSAPGDAPTTIDDLARHRNTNPASLERSLRGDLDCIVMRCLEKDRTRRYEAAAALAADVQRHLDDEPVTATPPSRRYRLHKLLRRNRGTVAASAAVLLALVLGVVGTTRGMLRARRAAGHALAEGRRADREAVEARRQAAVSDAVANFLNEDLLSAVRAGELGREVLVRDVLDAASVRLEFEFADEPLVAARLHTTVGVSYRSLGELEASEAHLERALELYERTLGRGHPSTLRSIRELGVLTSARGADEEAAALFRESLDGQLLALGADHSDTLVSMGSLGVALERLDRYGEAESLLARAVDGLRRVHGPEDERTLSTIGNLANLYLHLERFSDAEPLYREAYDSAHSSFAPGAPLALGITQNLAAFYNVTGQYAEGGRLLGELVVRAREVFGPEDARTIRAMHGLANNYLRAGRVPEAEDLYLEVLDLRRRVQGPDHPDTFTALTDLSLLYLNTGRFDDAEPLCVELCDRSLRLFGPGHSNTLGSLCNLGLLYLEAGRLEEAEPILAEALARMREHLPAGHPYARRAIEYLATLYEQAGRGEEALPLRREMLDFDVAAARRQNATATDLNRAAWMLLTTEPVGLRDPLAALEFALRAAGLTDHAAPEILDTLARALHENGDVDGALEVQRRAVELLPGDHEGRAAFEGSLARYELEARTRGGSGSDDSR